MIKAVRVKGSSMKPFLKDGFVFVDTRFELLKKGDLVLYQYENTLMIHRVVGFGDDCVIISNDDDMDCHQIRKDNIKGVVKGVSGGLSGYALHIFLKNLRRIKKLFK